jgi:hypothetical protein
VRDLAGLYHLRQFGPEFDALFIIWFAGFSFNPDGFSNLIAKMPE